MRLIVGLLLCGLLGCTSLNSAYADASSSSTGKPTSGSEATTTSIGASTTASDSAREEGPLGDTTATATVTSGVDSDTPTTRGDTGGRETTSSGSADTGVSKDPVLFLYATEIPFQPEVESDPAQFCLDTEPSGASSLCEGDVRVPFLALNGNVFEDALYVAEMLGPGADVHGIEGDGTTPIANASGEMYGGPLVPLDQAGVGLSIGEEFWTGEGSNCGDWMSFEGNGTIGSASATDAEWRSFGTAPCAQSRRFLCACVSIVDPFG